MTLSPETLTSKLLAWALALVLLIGVWALLIAPVLQNFSDRQDEASRLERLLSEYRARQEPLEPLREQIASAQATLKTSGGYFSGPNAAATTSALQTMARQIIEESRGSLRSSQVLPSVKSEGPQKHALRLDMQLPQEKLLDFLYAVSAADPYLFLENFDLRSPETVERPDAPVSPFTVRADIVGYARMTDAP